MPQTYKDSSFMLLLSSGVHKGGGEAVAPLLVAQLLKNAQ